MNIYQKNKMSYDIPDSLTLVKKRTQIEAAFDEENFDNVGGSEVLRCSWNTGEYMVSTKKSYLAIQLSVKSGVTSPFTFGSGSVMSIFRDIIIRSKSGVELCRMNDPKIWNKIKWYYDTPSTRKDQIEGVSGFPSTLETMSYASPEPTDNRKYMFTIPLDFLSPLFNTIDGSEYLPSQLAEGLTFEFYMAQLDTFCVMQGDPGFIPTQYNIHSVKFRLDGVILNDKSLMELQNRCHKKGLEWTCGGVYKQDIKRILGSEDVQNQINYSVSQALKADTVYQLSTRTNLAQTDKSRFLLVSSEFQYRSGSDYFPMNRIKDTSVFKSEIYMQAVYTHPETFTGLTSFFDNTIYSANLNLNDDLALSGIIVNNSKTLEFLGMSTPEWSDIDVDVSTLLHYVKVIKIVGTNVSVAT